MNKKEIDRIVREVLKESGLLKDTGQSVPKHTKKASSGPTVLFLCHAGVRYLKKSLVQIQQIDKIASRSCVFTAESTRAWVCGADVAKKAGIKCCLDKVKPEGIEKALQKADILVLPTFCLKTAVKIAHLNTDTVESAVVLSALAQEKKVLATCDSFTILDTLSNENIQKEIDRILAKLENFGMSFCDTDKLSTMFAELISNQINKLTKKRDKISMQPETDGLKLVTVKDIQMAVNNKQASISLAPGGVVTPLAQDQAKEYAIKIVKAG